MPFPRWLLLQIDISSLWGGTPHTHIYILTFTRYSARVNALSARKRVQVISAHARVYVISALTADYCYTRTRVHIICVLLFIIFHFL